MNKSLYQLNEDPTWFPPPSLALEQPPGLLAIGGDLSPQRLYNAYLNGIFPWFNEDEPILWWSPDPRAIINIGTVRLNKTLKKFLRRCNYQLSTNMAFEKVITACAEPRADNEGTWILPEMRQAYIGLHMQNHAHSIEILNDDKLIGGLYGVLVGNCFCGESMFSKSANASKLALLMLERLLSNTDTAFIDCQLPNPHLMNMGATLISRDVFLQKLKLATKSSVPKSLFSPKFIEWRSEIFAYDHS